MDGIKPMTIPCAAVIALRELMTKIRQRSQLTTDNVHRYYMIPVSLIDDLDALVACVEPPKDLLDALHAIFTRHGIASYSREHTGLVGDIVRWAADAARQSARVEPQEEKHYEQSVSDAGTRHAEEPVAEVQMQKASMGTDHGHGDLQSMQRPEIARVEPPPQEQTMADAAEMLWVVLSNVSGSDWKQQSSEWQEAAARWRDNYFAVLAAHRAPPTQEPTE